MTGETQLAGPEYERAMEVFRDLGDEEETDHLLVRIAIDARYAGDLERAARLASEALERFRVRGNRRDEAIALDNLAMVAFEQGDRELGLDLVHEAASVAESVGFSWWSGVALLSAAEWLIRQEDPEAAKAEFREGLATLAEVPDLVNLPSGLAAGAAGAAIEGDAVRAGTLWGAVEATGEREPRPTTTQALREYGPFVDRVRGAAFERGRAQGHTLSLEAAVEYALATID